MPKRRDPMGGYFERAEKSAGIHRSQGGTSKLTPRGFKRVTDKAGRRIIRGKSGRRIF